MNKEQKQFKEDLENLRPGEGVRLDDKTKYEFGADLQTEGAPIIDTGTGKNVVIREFTYKMNPQLKDMPDRQALFNAHAKQISTLLWGDGLRPLENISPRVIINIKDHFYKIYVPCEGRLGNVFVDKPKNLSEELMKSSKKAISKAK